MNTLHFKYAVEVERTRSITQAAENLYMAQPNLSKAIRELEETLGIAIFERSSKGVVPTRRGSEFLTYAKNILSQIDRMESLSVPENPGVQRFSISIPRGSYISSAFTSFAAELNSEKQIDIQLQETNSMQTITDIAEQKFNLGIIRYQTAYESYFLDYLDEKKICHDPIWEFEYLALMSRRHPLADVPEVPYDKLCQCTEIVHGDTIIPYISDRDNRNKPRRHAQPKKRIYVYERCSQFDLLSNIPSTFMWVSPIPDDLLRRYDLVQRRCKLTNHKYKDLLIYHKGYQFTTLEQKFLEKLHESKNRVAQVEYI